MCRRRPGAAGALESFVIVSRSSFLECARPLRGISVPSVVMFQCNVSGTGGSQAEGLGAVAFSVSLYQRVSVSEREVRAGGLQSAF